MVPSQPQPFPLRHDLTRRCRGRDGARGHGRAPRAGCGAHGGERTVRRPCILHAPHNFLHIMPRVLQHAPVIRRSAHQHLPRSPSTTVMAASTARTSGESVTCTCHAAIRRKTAYTCQYLVHNAGMRLRSAHCRRSIQNSRRRSRSSPLSAAQVMRRCETVAARSALSHAHAFFGLRVHWTLISRPGPMPCRVAYRTHKRNTADLQHNRLSLPARTIAPRAFFLQAPCEHAQYPL
jgi:hypothetical protein